VKLVLASGSPRRREILSNAGFSFVVRVSNVPEERQPHETATEYARRLAEEKAFAVPMGADEVVLAADTVVVLDEHILEKPCDPADAARMLRLLSAREHRVITGICLRSADGKIVDAETTRVHFVELSAQEIAAYAASGEPMDKAGGYAIQGLASKFIDRIDGCYFNVVGLPMAMVYRHLKDFGC
jgi:septum formation protein